MGFFNDSLTPLMGKKSSSSVNGTSGTDNTMDCPECCSLITPSNNWYYSTMMVPKEFKTSVYKGYKQDKIEMRGDRAEMSDFPLYLNTVAGGLDRRDQTIGGFSFVVKIYAVPVVEIIG
jgi:hypothetical protein